VILFSQKERKTEGIKAAPRRGVETDPPGVSVHSFFRSEKRRRFFPSQCPAKIFCNFKHYRIGDDLPTVPSLCPEKIFSNFKYTIYQL